jgi:hypothetical protein
MMTTLVETCSDGLLKQITQNMVLHVRLAIIYASKD